MRFPPVGFRASEAVFFLLEYTVWQRRRPVWLIMPIEREPRRFHYGIYLYRYDLATRSLEQLALITDQMRPQTSVAATLFRLDHERVVFAFRRGWSAEEGLLYHPFAWDLRSDRLLELAPPRGRRAPEMTTSFADYAGPATANPGVIAVGELRALLRDVPEEQWSLPRDW